MNRGVGTRIERSTLSVRDLASEAVEGMLARPGRTALTVLGTVLGIAALVATLGVASTAGSQIVGRFDALSATSLTIENQREGFSFGSDLESSSIPWDAEARLTRLNGVIAAGTMSIVRVDDLVSSVPINDPLGRTEHSIDVHAISPGLLDAVLGEIGTGRLFDEGHSERRDPVAVLGRGAAERLNISRVDHQPAIFIGETPFVVVGILTDVAREPVLLNSIMIPNGTARGFFDLQAVSAVHIRTELGATRLIGEQAPIALSPNSPGELRAILPPEPRGVREAVAADVNTLFLALGAVALLVGGIGIANVTLVSVLERVGEIGLRRAMGAARRHIAAQFLAESAAMGLIGGIIGASLGILAIVAVAATQSWTPVLNPWVAPAAAALGLAVGLLAGIYPSWRASMLEPVEALRAGV